MGCHTWCAYRVERPIEQARETWIKQQEKHIKELNEITDNPNSKYRILFPSWTQEYLKHSVEIYQRQLRMVKKGLCNVAVMNNQPELSYYIEGKGFFVNSEQDGDMFRIRGYPKDELFSKKECLDFIDKNKDKIQFNDNTYERLDWFWDKYPDGYMHFG